MTYADIISYFERLATAHVGIRASYCGDYDRIYDVKQHTDKYDLPALWIESPEMSPVGTDDSIQESWSLSIVILHKGNNQNAELNKYESEMSYRTAKDFLYRILRDESEGYLRRYSVINKTLSYIDPYSSDYLIGWRINLTLITKASGCYNADVWNETIGVASDLSFRIIKDDTDIVTDSVIKPTIAGWVWTWHYSINDATPSTSTSDNISINDASTDRVYISLRGVHAASGLTRVASAYYLPGMTAIASVPYLYDISKQD